MESFGYQPRAFTKPPDHGKREGGNALAVCALKVTRTSSILVKSSANLLSSQTTLGCWWSIWFQIKMIMVTVNISDTSCQLEGTSWLCAGGRWHNPVAQSSNPRLWEHHPSPHTSHLWWSVQTDPSSFPCALAVSLSVTSCLSICELTNRLLHLGF